MNLHPIANHSTLPDMGASNADHDGRYIPYSSLAGDVYTLDTAGITLTAGTLTAAKLTITDNPAYGSFDITVTDGSPEIVEIGYTPLFNNSTTMKIQKNGNGSIELFGEAPSGYTPTLKLSGYKFGDELRTLSFSIDDSLFNTAIFEGVGAYKLDGNIVGTGDFSCAGDITTTDGVLSVYDSSGTVARTNLGAFRGHGTDGTGSSYISVTRDNAVFTEIETNGQTSGFRYGGQWDTNIVNTYPATSAYGNINFITGGVNGGIRLQITGGSAGGLVGIGVTPTVKFEIGSTDNSDSIKIYHDNEDMHIKWTDGVLNIQTDEGDNTDTSIFIKGKGTGIGILNLNDEDNAERLVLKAQAAYGYIETVGSDPGNLRFQHQAVAGIECFGNCAEGQTRKLSLYGHKTGGAQKYNLDIEVCADADDTVSFSSVSNYFFDGNIGAGIQPTAALTLKAGTAAAGTGPLKFTAGTALTSPETGVLEFHDSRLYMTNKSVRKALDRTSDVAVETVTVANSASETVLWTGTMPANSLVAGNVLKFQASGLVSNNGNHADNDFTIRVRVGGIAGAEIISLTPTTKAMTDEHWHIKANATQRTVGAAGSRAAHLHLQVGDADEEEVIAMATIDTTANMDVVVTVDWVTAHANNSISLYQGFMEYKN